jgi:hexosaminidase
MVISGIVVLLAGVIKQRNWSRFMNQSLAASLLLLSVGAFHLHAADPADSHPHLHLIPWPKSVKAEEGYLGLSADTRIVAEDERLVPLANVVVGEIKLLTGLNVKTATGKGGPGDIVLRIDPELRAGAPILRVREREFVRSAEGAHTIDIGSQATITGYDYRAAAEGTATLLQLLGKSDDQFRFPKIKIKDWPHADYCGVMLDVARQDHSLDDVKKVVLLCRLYKARYLQLHLTDDQGWTFPSTKYPQLGTKNYGAHGGIAPRRYKLDELKELVAYADARGVTIVPEFEVPGHSGAAVRAMPEVFDAIHPETKQPIGIGCMNMSSEALYPVLDTLIGEMCEVFHSSPYFHIGSDEVTSGRLSLNPSYRTFMDKHRLKDDHELANHFVREVCGIVKKHGKKAIKWEGLANFATKDVIIMCWEGNSTFATEAQARGYTTITCPWNLAVPWQDWNMYSCNASQLKRSDAVLGATLVAWEQPPLTHITNLRNLASRQERTWGPDNQVTVSGFAERFQPLDAIAGKLIDLPPKALRESQISTPLGTKDFLEPGFSLDGNDATYYESAVAPKAGDHFTITFPQPQSLHAIEVLTGSNGHGLLEAGELQVSADGKQFQTVGKLKAGSVRAVLKENRLLAVRLLATSPEKLPLVVRSINLQSLVELSGAVSNPAAVVGNGSVAALRGDTEFTYPIGACAMPVINRGFTLKLNNGGNAYSYSGPISGKGSVELQGAGPQAPLLLDGSLPNTLDGNWQVFGSVTLAKTPGVAALGGSIIVGGKSDHDAINWNASDQIDDKAQIKVLRSSAGAGRLLLNGHRERVGRLELADGAKLSTGSSVDGVLTVEELIVDGKRQPTGVYTSSEPWLEGNGYVVVGKVEFVDTQGTVKDPAKVFASSQIAALKGSTTFELTTGECATAVIVGNHPFALAAQQEASFSGFVTGTGPIQITAPSNREPLSITGRSTNTYSGATVLTSGVLKLGKERHSIAIPGNLTLGGSSPENVNDGVVWNEDGQLAPSATVTLQGTQPSFLDLNGHQASLSKVTLSKVAQIRTGERGILQVKQFHFDGKRLKDGEYNASQSWLKGTGKVIVDARVDVQGIVGSPESQIGSGNVANLTGKTTFAYPASGCPVDVITNGHTLVLDSGNGNAFALTGSISGNGNVEFHMGPSYTDYKDAPLPIAGDRPNTATGKFLVRKGRVQLEKPKGVDAISGDVIVGGQGFNDCLFWKQGEQIKDTVHITLVDAGSNGAAYLDLNGHVETVASLTLTSKNKVRTASAEGVAGILTVKALVIDGVSKPAGKYMAETEKWIDGKGAVMVAP